ncbi:anti-sigma factor antagonist [Streptomyces sp. NPDC008150]|uniref:anti-sigma factor antagonist n=1 Tax=Streptomyces sp. NPDC008150 TaxID=3364816 RepID=UPI0036E68573
MSSTAAGDRGLEVVTTRHHAPPAYVIALRGDADLQVHKDMEEAFDQVHGSRLDLVVDLSGLTFGDELLLGLLLTARTADPTVTVTLVGPICDSFRRRLDVTGTTDVFTTHPTLATALDALDAADEPADPEPGPGPEPGSEPGPGATDARAD